MQGFNMGKYVPPDAEGVYSGNQLSNKHPLGHRASKLASQGILTVRFELPFAVWCDTCQPHPTIIGQGVRFNAAKKKVGNYYSTPIWSFTIKHAACGGEIEIRTDPKNTRYVVVSGGRARDAGTDEDSLVKLGEGGNFEIQTEKERQEQRDAAFGKLEKTIADRERVEEAKVRIDELLEAQDKSWEDPYARNQKLRKAFRVGRKEREREAERTEDLKERMGLGIELLPGTEEDEKRAKLIEFGGVPDGIPFGRDDVVQKALARPLFVGDEKGNKEEKNGKKKDPYKGKLKSEIAAIKMRETLVSEIVGNTRAAKDPFLDWGSRESSLKPRGALIPGLKRKRPAGEETPDPPPAMAYRNFEGSEAGSRNEQVKSEEESPPAALATADSSTTQTSKPGLVAYDSDSD
ncbi:CWC16 protein [Sordaria brevicollis]|uniref:CWC16 protein n=1 Tax=Sordaria brevicollis TaxID=83679 RepID=A0AAE0PKP5_SORBR|nr:CWC16 protein [Sordaria brevicollis]